VAPCEQTIERLLMIADLLEQGKGHIRWKAVDAHAAVCILDADARELLRIRDRQRAQTDDIEEMKDRGVGADAERERQDGDECEDRAFPQRSHCVSEIDSHGVDPPEAPRLAHPFLPRLGPAEFEPSPPRGFFRSHA
jgi:hypothetical protein